MFTYLYFMVALPFIHHLLKMILPLLTYSILVAPRCLLFVDGYLYGYPSGNNQTIYSRVMLLQRDVLEIAILKNPLMNCALYCDRSCTMFAVIQQTCRLFALFARSLPLQPYSDFQKGYKIYSHAQIPPENYASLELLVFRQDSSDGIFWPHEVVALNKNDPTAKRYSMLDEIDDFRANDGHFHFKMCYPELHNSLCYRWSQSDNPLLILGQATPRDFTYKEGPFPKAQYFKGLSRSTPFYSLLDVDLTGPEYWWCPIGAYEEFGSSTTFPGPRFKTVAMVELFLEL
ncbi:uncharacterized protein LOC131879461 [Tigriopus californicus]|uniref:uncharacterized protein LOC131879461 n=1 Tax=Tigriopus californicus TaxID=6832 RepID=UPI0027DA6A24|nr:uncharacterized protein LOC131879461 [Tigriopus californicus]